MENLLLEELKRIRNLNSQIEKSSYMQHEDILQEQNWLKDLFKTGAEEGRSVARELESGKNLLKAVEADRSLGTALAKDMESVAKDIEKFGGIKGANGKQLKSADEILAAIKSDMIAPAELGRFNITLFKETTNPKIAEALAKDISSSPSFITKYSKKTRSEVVSALEAKGFSKGQANKLFDGMMLKVAEDSKIATDLKPTEDLRNIEDVKAADETKSAKDLETSSSETKELSSSEIEDVERQLKDAQDELNQMRDKKPNSLMKWFNDLGIVKWGKRSISAAWLFKIALIAGGGWLAWYIFFKDHGVDTKCEEGEELDMNTGKCKKSQGGQEEEEEITPVPDYDPDEDPTTFVDCVDIYKKGCKDKEDNIERVQDCLGLPVTGNFDKRTEDAIYEKINKRNFTRGDIAQICKAKPSGLKFRF